MSCCGKARAAARDAMPAQSPAVVPPARIPLPIGQTIQFEYVGTSSLTIVGPVTGQRYHFAAPGARLGIDVRDRRYLQNLPRLRQLV